MDYKEKAKELGKKYSKPCHGMGDCEFEATQAALEMAEWLREEYKKIFKNSYDGTVTWYDGMWVDPPNRFTEDGVLLKMGAKVGDKIKVVLIKI